MSKGFIVKLVSIAIGVIVAVSLISKHPVHITLLGVCAGAYFVGEAIEKGKIG